MTARRVSGAQPFAVFCAAGAPTGQNAAVFRSHLSQNLYSLVERLRPRWAKGAGFMQLASGRLKKG